MQARPIYSQISLFTLSLVNELASFPGELC
jgi:hypothetical protein